MKKTTLTEAVTEAERFLASAKRLKEAYARLCSDTADVRRKSMDLTKALARLRKNE